MSLTLEENRKMLSIGCCIPPKYNKLETLGARPSALQWVLPGLVVSYLLVIAYIIIIAPENAKMKPIIRTHK